MPNYVVKAAGLCPEPISIAHPAGGAIVPELCRTGMQLIRTMQAVEPFDNELTNKTVLEITRGVIDWTFPADDGKLAAGIAIAEFVNRFQAARQLTPGHELESIVTQTDETIIYIEISPTKHLKSSGLLIAQPNGTRRPWLFDHISVPTSDQSDSYLYRLFASAFVLVERA